MPTTISAVRKTDEVTSEPPAFLLRNPQIHSVSNGSGYKTVVSVSTSEPTPSNLEDAPNYPRYEIHPLSSGSDSRTVVAEPESRIVATTFSTQPDVWRLQLSQDYQELGTTLSELTALDETAEWKIDASVYSTATYVAANLKYYSIRAPQIFVHGPTSVVFNWSDNLYNFYLTIGTNSVSALLSSAECIIARREYTEIEWSNPVQLIPPIQPAFLGGPTIFSTRSVSHLPDFFA